MKNLSFACARSMKWGLLISAIMSLGLSVCANAKDSTTYDQLVKKAEALIDVDSKNARSLLERAIKINGRRSEAYVELVRLEPGSKQAMTYALKSIDLSPKSARAFYALGLAKTYSGKNDEAVKFYTKALELDATFSRAYHQRAHIYHSQNKQDLAIADLSKEIAIKPSAHSLGLRGLIYGMKRKERECLNDCTKAIAMEPSAVSYANRARQHHNFNSLDLAQQDYSKAIDLFRARKENDLLYHYLTVRSEFLAQRGMFKEALNDCTELFKLKPNAERTYRVRGYVRALHKDYAGACADFTSASNMNPTCQQSLLNRSETYLKLGRYDLAVLDAHTAISLNPTNPEAHYQMATMHHRMNQLDKAIDSYSKAITFNPQNISYLSWRAVAYRQSGKASLAESDNQRIRELSGTNKSQPNYVLSGIVASNLVLTGIVLIHKFVTHSTKHVVSNRN